MLYKVGQRFTAKLKDSTFELEVVDINEEKKAYAFLILSGEKKGKYSYLLEGEFDSSLIPIYETNC